MASVCAAVFQMDTSDVASTITLNEICIFYKKLQRTIYHDEIKIDKISFNGLSLQAVT